MPNTTSRRTVRKNGTADFVCAETAPAATTRHTYSETNRMMTGTGAFKKPSRKPLRTIEMTRSVRAVTADAIIKLTMILMATFSPPMYLNAAKVPRSAPA